jgi:glycosyltransferase involved in cell wall biosynthesis
VRVLLWGELFWPNLGGAELFAANLMRALRPHGYEFAVVASHDYEGLPDEDRYQDIPVYRFRFREALAPGRIEELLVLRHRVAALCRDLAPALIHLNGIGPNVFFCRNAAQSLRVPLLVRVNRELGPPSKHAVAGTLVTQVLQRAAWVIGVSAATLEQARAIAPAIATRSSLIYNGVDSAADMPDAAPAGPPRILCLGRLAREKRFDLAIGALPAILQRSPAARLTVAGDGPERAALVAQAGALGVAPAVEFIGWVAPDAVAPVIAAATVVVLPSQSEGLPAVALQAAALGRPVVATRTGGLPEIVQHGDTGLLVEPDGRGLAAAIVALLDDPAMARRLGRAAWRRAREVFDQQRCVDAYDALYRQLAVQAP